MTSDIADHLGFDAAPTARAEQPGGLHVALETFSSSGRRAATSQRGILTLAPQPR